MNIVTLTEIKAQTRIEGSAEDTYLSLLGDSAEATVLNILNRTLEDLYDTYGTIPVPIKHAVLMLVSHSYTMREPASIQNLYTVPYTLDALVKPYMIL